MTDPLDRVRRRVNDYMIAISGLFRPGVKITVIVRSPGYPDRDFMMTDDKEAEVLALIERRRDLGDTIMVPPDA
jgi:hypothetical protein